MNAETMLVQYLAPLAGVHVSTDVPPNRPRQFITVERAGGTEDRFSSRPMLAVQAWGGSRTECGNLAQKVRTLLLQAVSLPRVSDVQVLSVSNYPDPGPPASARYQVVVQLTIQASD